MIVYWPIVTHITASSLLVGVIFFRRVTKPRVQGVRFLHGRFKLIIQHHCTLQQALTVPLACSQLLPCFLQCRVFFSLNLLSNQFHCLGTKQLRKTCPRFLLSRFPLLFALISHHHHLLVELALRFSVLQTSLFLLLFYRFRWFGPATLPCGWFCDHSLRFLLHLFHLTK